MENYQRHLVQKKRGTWKLYTACGFLLFPTVWEIDVRGKTLNHCDSCMSVVPNTVAHIETI